MPPLRFPNFEAWLFVMVVGFGICVTLLLIILRIAAAIGWIS